MGLTAPRGKADPSFTVWYQKFNIKQYVLVSSADIQEQWIDNIKQILWQQMVDKRGKIMHLELPIIRVSHKIYLKMEQFKKIHKYMFFVNNISMTCILCTYLKTGSVFFYYFIV